METSKIPTAEEIIIAKFKDSFLDFEYLDLHIEAMEEFARLHVTAALEAVIEKVDLIDVGDTDLNGQHVPNILIDEQSILNAYPLDNIK